MQVIQSFIYILFIKPDDTNINDKYIDIVSYMLIIIGVVFSCFLSEMKIQMTESVIHIKSPQLIGFSCVIPTWGKKRVLQFP